MTAQPAGGGRISIPYCGATANSVWINSDVTGVGVDSIDAMGVCVGLPLTCQEGGPSARACTNQNCALVCSLMASNNPWFDDGTCP